MTSMSLYGGNSGTGSNSSNPYHWFSSSSSSAYPLANNHHGGSLSLLPPRNMKRHRRKKQQQRPSEMSLYPSVAAVEEAVPETILSFHENGTFEVICLSAKKKQAEDEQDCSMTTTEQKEEQQEEEENPLDISSQSSSSSVCTTTTNSSVSSDHHLSHQFRNLSVKRKPLASSSWPVDDDDEISQDDDDPLGSLLTLAPRRKVSRHSAVHHHSQHGRGSSTRHGPSHYHQGTSTSTGREALDSIPPASAAALSLSSSALSGTTSSLSNSLISQRAPIRRRRLSHSNKEKEEEKEEENENETDMPQDVEIEPGVFVPLRVGNETRQAIQNGFVEEIFCQACDVELICIADVSYCICPDCKFVNPVHGGMASLRSSSSNKLQNSGTSAGLGIKVSSSSAALSSNRHA